MSRIRTASSRAGFLLFRSMLIATIVGSGLVAGCATTSDENVQPGLLGTSDLTAHCQQLWASDRESFHLCQQLQNRNRISLTGFANAHGVNGDNLERKTHHKDPVATAISTCISRWRPDYTSVWRCVQEKTKRQAT